MAHPLFHSWQAVCLAVALSVAGGCQVSLDGVPISEDDAEELVDDDADDDTPPSDDAGGPDGQVMEDDADEADPDEADPDEADQDETDDAEPLPVDDGGPVMDAGAVDAGAVDAGAVDAGEADADASPPVEPEQGPCIADEAFAAASCAAAGDSSPYVEPYCACAAPEVCSAHRPLATCSRGVARSAEVELELGGGDAALLEGDLTVHFRTTYDSVLSRGARYALRGEELSVWVEHEGVSLWAEDVARGFPEGCEEEADGDGRCTESVPVESRMHCYQHCAALPTMQVWSYQQLDESSPAGSCQCSETAGKAVPSARARSGRLRDAPTVTPELAAPAEGNTRSTLAADLLPQPTDLETCKSSCLAAAQSASGPRCLSWVYTPENGNCYLQDDTRALWLRYPFEDHVTGLSPAGALVEQVLASSLADDTDRPFADNGSLYVTNWDGCADECARRSSCRVFSYSKDRAACYLKEGATAPVPNVKTASAIRPTLVVHVRHATAKGGAAEVKLRAHRQGYFDDTLAIVRNAETRKYTLYVGGAWASDAYYTQDPRGDRASVQIARDAAALPDDMIPVSELAFFDQRLDRAALEALSALEPPTTAPDPVFPEPDAGEPDAGEPDAGEPSCAGPDCSTLLDGLTASRGTLSPAFHPFITDYTLRVKPWEDSVDLRAAAEASVALTLDGAPVAAGEVSRLSLMPGSRVVTLTASRGQATRTYTLHIERSARAAHFLKASDGQAGDTFGQALAISADGNTMVVGSPGEDSSGSGVDPLPDEELPGSGAVYVLTRNPGGGFTETAFIKATNPGVADHFGQIGLALSGDGNTLAVAATGEDSPNTGIESMPTERDGATEAGAVYVYARGPGGGWLPEAYVKPHNTGGNDAFGVSVALSYDGSTMAVGALREDSSTRGVNPAFNESSANAGAAYVFTRSAGAWQQQAFLKAGNTGNDDRFGTSVSLDGSGDVLVVGALTEDSSAAGVNPVPNEAAWNAGAAYVFRRSLGNSWAQEAYLKASNPGQSDYFGDHVALSLDGSTLAISAPGEDSSALGLDDTPDEGMTDSGAVYVFVHGIGGWQQHAYLKASNASTSDAFGQSVSLSVDGSVLAVGAGFERSLNGDEGDHSADKVGAAYVFSCDAERCSQKAYLKAWQLSPHDRFGTALVLGSDGRTLLVGAPLEDSSSRSDGAPNENASDSGAVFVF